MTNDQFQQSVLREIRETVARHKLRAENDEIRESFAEIEPQEIEPGCELFENLRRINQPEHFDMDGESDDSRYNDPRRM